MRPGLDVVTHYSRGEPFRSITGVGSSGWAEVVSTLTSANTWGLARFADPDYLPRRAAVEARLREAFVAAGGTPTLTHPIYAVLGRLATWERQQTAGMRAYVVPLASIASTAISFTYGDSLLTWDADYRAARLAKGRNVHPDAGRVFRLEPLAARVSRMTDAEIAELPVQLEVQLWNRPEDAVVDVIDL